MRKLARVVKIDKLEKHFNADTLDILTIGGWKVVAKSGLHKEGDHVIYLEIDSFVPTTLAPFLTKEGKTPKQFEGVSGEVLKTIKLRGQLSQGMVIPIRETPIAHMELSLEQDVTDLLGILKYEKPLPASLAGNIRCHFPSVVPKTDAERIQNLSTELEFWKSSSPKMYVTEKLDGTSFTCMRLNEDIHVCSRNYSLYETEGNTYWNIFRKNNLESVLKSLPFNAAIQGEIVGHGIQENQYGLKNQELYVFSIYDIDNKSYLSYDKMKQFCEDNSLNSVPFIQNIELDSNVTIENLLEKADGASVVGSNSSNREGLVWRGFDNPEICFKTISNTWLLKQ
jgi:RNA ligase (TIGR02306 family)